MYAHYYSLQYLLHLIDEINLGVPKQVNVLLCYDI